MRAHVSGAASTGTFELGELAPSPAVVSAQVPLTRVEMAVTPEFKPTTSTGTGESR